MEEICIQNCKDTPQTKAELVCKAELSFVPDVSVVLIACNTAKYLRQAIETLLCQTLKTIEIICVNDGSTDETLEILKEYGAKDGRITILNHKQNFGAAVARNAGLAVAQGKYLFFLDSDDFFDPDMCEKMFQQAQKDEADIVVSGYYCCDADGTILKIKHSPLKYIKASPVSPLKFKDNLFFIIPPNTWTKLFRTELVRQKEVFFENLKSCNDYTFSYTMLAASNKISLIKTPFVHYRTNTGTNISSNFSNKTGSILQAVMALKRNLERFGLEKQYHHALIKSAAKCFKGVLRCCSSKEKQQFFKQMPVFLEKDFAALVEKQMHMTCFRFLLKFFKCPNNEPCILSKPQENLIEPARVKSPKISVIVPVYNVEKYLSRCLNSILAQTFTDFELICVNDGSTDNSLKILEDFAEKDARIKIITQQNQGISVARNSGFKIARGRWCLFIDSDDAIHPQTFEICSHFAKRYDADLVCFRFEKSDGHTYNTANIKSEDIPFKTTDNPLLLSLSKSRFRIPFSACTKFYKTSAICDIKFLEHINFEDCAHTYAFLSKHPKTVILDAALYFYTQNPSSVSNMKSSENQLLYYRKIMLYLDEIYRGSTYAHDLKIIYQKLYPKLLNNQYKCCRNAEKQAKHNMLRLFAQSLKIYQQRHMISFTGCGLFKYLRYRRIAQKY